MTEYDADNIFAKFVDGKIPCFKVFESKTAIAFLDAFPKAEGHTLLIPKYKGATSFLEMPPAKASEFLRDLQKVGKAVKAATGASGINIWENDGKDAGQMVFHPHFHIVPRFADDGKECYPPSAKEMLTKEAATPVVDKIAAALNPPKPLKTAKFNQIAKIKPDSTGLNLKVQCVEEVKAVGSFYEAVVGDASGSVVVSLREEQKDALKAGKSYEIRNCSVKMQAEGKDKTAEAHIRIIVTKWGKIAECDEAVEADKTAKNISDQPFEQV